jgi:hypothetical protein
MGRVYLALAVGGVIMKSKKPKRFMGICPKCGGLIQQDIKLWYCCSPKCDWEETK